MTEKDYEQIAYILCQIIENHRTPTGKMGSIKVIKIMDYFGEELMRNNTNFNISKFFGYIRKGLQK